MRRLLIDVRPYARPAGWREYSRAQYRSMGSGDATTTSGQVARPCTSTCGGIPGPLPVGSLKSSETRGSRRMLNAFVGRPMDVVSVKVPVPASYRGMVGHAIAVPDRGVVGKSPGGGGGVTPG